RGRAEENLVDATRFMQVELDARAVLEHLEADGVLAADELLLGIDADVEMVEEQVVVGAIRPVLAAQDVGVRGGLRRARPAKKNTQCQGAVGPVAHDATLSCNVVPFSLVGQPILAAAGFPAGAKPPERRVRGRLPAPPPPATGNSGRRTCP